MQLASTVSAIISSNYKLKNQLAIEINLWLNLELMKNAIQIAIDLVGLSAIAAAYEPPISPQAVHKWIEKGVPADRCRVIEEITNGSITRAMLRPELFGEEAA
jgi:DNA-binding transcriptional regulator YdaS (Cro superfamily)